MARECHEGERTSVLYEFIKDIEEMQGYYCIAQLKQIERAQRLKRKHFQDMIDEMEAQAAIEGGKK